MCFTLVRIKQPWASLICTPRIDNTKLGIKDIENRSWRTKYRGKFLIHAAAIEAGFIAELLNEKQFDALCKNCYPGSDDFPKFPLSAIIGEVTLVDCAINHPSVWAGKTLPELWDEDGNPIYDKPVWNWVLKTPILYDEPILNVKGKLSFWEFEK